MLSDDSNHLVREDALELSWAQWFELIIAKDFQVKSLETFQSCKYLQLECTNFISPELNALVMMFTNYAHTYFTRNQKVSTTVSFWVKHHSLYSFNHITQSDQGLDF